MLWTLINEAPAQVREADQGLRGLGGEIGVWRVGGRTCSFSVSADWELVLAGPTHVSILSSMTCRRVAAGEFATNTVDFCGAAEWRRKPETNNVVGRGGFRDRNALRKRFPDFSTLVLLRRVG
ncbi:hypothetical protein [Azospirillum argentinense]